MHSTEPVRRCIVPISTELLEELLLPPGSVIVAAKGSERVRNDGSPETLELVVENPLLPHVERGNVLTRIPVVVTEERRRVEFEGLHQDLPSDKPADPWVYPSGFKEGEAVQVVCTSPRKYNTHILFSIGDRGIVKKPPNAAGWPSDAVQVEMSDGGCGALDAHMLRKL